MPRLAMQEMLMITKWLLHTTMVVVDMAILLQGQLIVKSVCTSLPYSLCSGVELK